MSFNSSKWVSMGAVLQCPHLKGLRLSPMVQGSQAEGRLLGEELFGSHANEVTQLQSFSLQSSRGKRQVIFLRALCKVKQQEESEVCLCSGALARGRCVLWM